ncbi:DUF484 family protein [Sessilibacter corallicola]|uniref:DUF484 family protein n=1 Tax=Sessilibacter corallicola TaxID=2904075 RepID=UPI001E5145DB|nr:DUF484 family protein [Sessilibacter corallicola]
MEISIANENRRLREIVQQLLDRIDDNQRIQRHFHNFELSLLNSTDLHSTISLLLDEACRHFRLASSSLILLDTEGSLEELFDATQVNYHQSRLQLRRGSEFYDKIYPDTPRVLLQEVDVLTATRLFPGTPKVGSAAFLPLQHQTQIFGSLHFASSDSARFVASKGTDLLDHLAAVTSQSLRHTIAIERENLKSLLDPILEIGNARYFNRTLSRELDRARREASHLSCMLLIVNAHNEQLTPVLKSLVKELKENIRRVDVCSVIDENCIAVLLPGSDSRQSQTLADRIRRSTMKLGFGDQVAIGVHSWKARKTKNGLSEDALEKAGVELVSQAKEKVIPLNS